MGLPNGLQATIDASSFSTNVGLQGETMSLTDRVFKAFETELVKHLRFTFTVSRRVDAKGNPKTRIRVWMSNESGIVLKNVRGAVSPGRAADFRFTTFYLERLGPKKEAEIACIDADVLDPSLRNEQMATVNVSGEPDLSTYRFKDTARQVTYVAARIAVEGAEETAPRVDPFERPEEEPPTLQLDWSRVSRKKPA